MFFRVQLIPLHKLVIDKSPIYENNYTTPTTVLVFVACNYLDGVWA